MTHIRRFRTCLLFRSMNSSGIVLTVMRQGLQGIDEQVGIVEVISGYELHPYSLLYRQSRASYDTISRNEAAK